MSWAAPAPVHTFLVALPPADDGILPARLPTIPGMQSQRLTGQEEPGAILPPVASTPTSVAGM